MHTMHVHMHAHTRMFDRLGSSLCVPKCMSTVLHMSLTALSAAECCSLMIGPLSPLTAFGIIWEFFSRSFGYS